MKRVIFTLLICTTLCGIVFAQAPKDDANRQKWLGEMRNVKHEYMVKELSLTDDQQKRFFDAYDQMEDTLMQVAADIRDLEAKVLGDADPSDIEMESAARALFEQKSREGQIELQYFDEFRQILQPAQLLKLKGVERQFNQRMLRQHGRVRGDQPQRSDRHRGHR